MKHRYIIFFAIIILFCSKIKAFELWNGIDTNDSKEVIIQKVIKIANAQPLLDEYTDYILWSLDWLNYKFDHKFSNKIINEVAFYSSLSAYDSWYRQAGNIRLYFYDNKIICIVVAFNLDNVTIRQNLQNQYGSITSSHNSSSFTSTFYLWETNNRYIINNGKQVIYFDKVAFNRIAELDEKQSLKNQGIIF